MSDIIFGTSGHRGIIGQSFTMEHLRAIILAINAYFSFKNIESPRVLIGYDTRTGNSPSLDENSYTHCAISELIRCKITVDFCDSYTATPILSWAVRHHDYDLGIILTASHNPPNYNGIKINDSDGAPANVEITQWIQTEANKQLETLPAFKPISIQSSYNAVNYDQHFIAHCQHILHHFQLQSPSFSKPMVIDPKCGTAISIWNAIVPADYDHIIWLNNTHSSGFNNELPNPTSQHTKDTLGHFCKQHDCIGISNDPDSDRHIMIDENGHAITPEKLTVILINYCNEHNIQIDSVATTLANSALVKTVCQRLSIPIHETQIGFKYFSPFFKQAAKLNKLCIGVESSGGFSLSNHTFDKCGFIHFVNWVLCRNNNNHLQNYRNILIPFMNP